MQPLSNTTSSLERSNAEVLLHSLLFVVNVIDSDVG